MLEWRSYLHTNIDKKQMKGLFHFQIDNKKISYK